MTCFSSFLKTNFGKPCWKWLETQYKMQELKIKAELSLTSLACVASWSPTRHVSTLLATIPWEIILMSADGVLKSNTEAQHIKNWGGLTRLTKDEQHCAKVLDQASFLNLFFFFFLQMIHTSLSDLINSSSSVQMGFFVPRWTIFWRLLFCLLNHLTLISESFGHQASPKLNVRTDVVSSHHKTTVYKIHFKWDIQALSHKCPITKTWFVPILLKHFEKIHQGFCSFDT